MADKMPVLRGPKPARRGSRRLLFILLLLFAVLLAVLFFRSSISKISAIGITGQQYVGMEDIRQAAGVSVGDPFFYPGKSVIARRVEALAPVESVAVSKSFPGKVDIQVKEYPAVAFELSDSGDISVILSNGVILPAGADFVVDKPVLSGWQADDPVKPDLIRALAAIPPELLNDFSEIVPYPSNSYKDRIKIYTRSKFEVVTAASLLPEKAETIRAVAEQQEPGVITLLLADRYAPYEPHDGGHESADENETTQ